MQEAKMLKEQQEKAARQREAEYKSQFVQIATENSNVAVYNHTNNQQKTEKETSIQQYNISKEAEHEYTDLEMQKEIRSRIDEIMNHYQLAKENKDNKTIEECREMVNFAYSEYQINMNYEQYTEERNKAAEEMLDSFIAHKYKVDS